LGETATAATTTAALRPRVASTAATAATAAIASANSNPNAVNALADGLTFVEKDCITSVQTLVEMLQSKAPPSVGAVRKALGFVMTHIESGSLPGELKEAIAKDPTGMPLFTGLYNLIGCAVRTRIKEKEFAAELNKIGVPQAFAADIATAFNTKREALLANAQTKRIALPTVTDLSWRVDVAVSTTALSRVFKPAIVMQLTLSDNSIKTFECSVEKFHELRYNVAKLLKSMQDVEQHPTLQRVE